MKVQRNTLYLSGKVTKEEVPDLFKEWNTLIKRKAAEGIRGIDLTEVTMLDSAGTAFLTEISRQKGKNLPLLNIPEDLLPTVELFYPKEGEEEEIEKKEEETFLSYIGGWIYELRDTLSKALMFGIDLFFTGFSSLFSKKGKRKGGFTEQCIEIGMNSTPVIVLLALIVGVILTLQSAVQLKRFGGNVFVADLLSLSLIREMGPILTSIIMAGKTGSAITSEIGAMKVGDELDAIKMMGLSPLKYLILPKYYAMVVSLPLLVALSDVIGVFSGMLISLMYLDLTPTIFLDRVISVLDPIDIFHGFAKVPVFAWAIVTISAHFGLTVEGGASEVGKATTDSVVVSIFTVVLIDAIFSLFYLA